MSNKNNDDNALIYSGIRNYINSETYPAYGYLLDTLTLNGSSKLKNDDLDDILSKTVIKKACCREKVNQDDENYYENEDENEDDNYDENYDENEDENEDEINTLNPTIDNDTLFALRTHYQDYYEDETDIIQMLKTNLMDQHYSELQANTSLREFYNSFGINIDLTIFEEVQSLPSEQELFNEFINSVSVNNAPNNGILVSQLMNVINNMPNNIFNNVLIPPEDILCTLDEEEKEKLNKFILETKIDQKCNICLEDMIAGEEVVVLPCDHTYHSNCILTYLEEYNYKCPICRKEVGKPKYNT